MEAVVLVVLVVHQEPLVHQQVLETLEQVGLVVQLVQQEQVAQQETLVIYMLRLLLHLLH